MSNNKPTQAFKMFELMKAGEEITTSTIASKLDISISSVPVYIHEMKRQFKADIKSIRDGRRVTAYQLINAAKVKVPEFRKNALGEIPTKVKPKIITNLAEELESVNNGTVSEREFADIRSSLGLDFGGFSSGGRGGNDY